MAKQKRKSKSQSRSVKSVQKPKAKLNKFPIVGIGASAGGLEAFTKLLSHLPSDTGMAFVLIQHLSPRYESFLTEILAKSTTMPIAEVRDGVLIEPNSIYVIPPNVSMTLEKGRLRLVRREESERPHLVIDFFFRSLAEEQKNDAIGIVLSGTGSDGAEGLKMIKGEGGITIAQLPDSAKFGGMPRRAISVDHVDFVLTPEEISRELVKISKHPYLKLSEVHPTEDPLQGDKDDKANVDRILQLVRQTTGVDFRQYKSTTVHRRIMRRMAVRRVDHFAAYLKVMREDRAEQLSLHDDILINVTSFFRDPEVFEKLKSVIFPALLKKRRPGETIRVWVAGCATGEEAYSIAIALLEFLGDRANQYPIQIFGSDLSEQCITRARAGKYMEGITESVSKERLARYFVASDKGYVVSKAVRDCCVFAKQDILNDPPYSRLDLISCRNVLIYLEPSLQRKALGIFSYAMKPSGYLVLGKSETPSVASNLFNVVSKKEKLYSVSPKASRAWPRLKSSSQNHELFPKRSKAPGGAPELESIEKDTDQLILNHFAPACVVINEQMEVVQFRGDTAPFLANQTGRPSFQILKMARDGLGPQLKYLITSAKRGIPAKSKAFTFRSGNAVRSVSIEVLPLRARTEGKYFFILFRDTPSPEVDSGASVKRGGKGQKAAKYGERQILELKQELSETKQYLESLNNDLESTNQDLQSANEEVLSANEELQSTNEELETAKEELQSSNEELTTVNDELQSRNTELDHLNNDLSNLLSNIDIPILMIGRDGMIRKITPAAQRVLNLLPGDVGRPIRDIKSNFEVLGLELNLERQVAEVVDTMAVTEGEIKDRNGHWYRLQIRPYRTLDNRIDGAVIALIDIDILKRGLTEVSQARVEAEKARELAEAGNRAKDLFLATLSHELRTPLTTILSYSQLLRLGKLNPEDSKKGILMIEQSAQTQAQLINDLLDVSRIIMGKLSLDIQNVDPAAILHTAVESIRPLTDRKSIKVVEELTDQQVIIRADPVRLKQVFLNLLTNAVKFSQTGGVIEVHLKCFNESLKEAVRVHVQIRDFGKGIPAKFLPHLFDRFSQADSSSTRVHGGMGLGLAIVRSLVEAQNGLVNAVSPGEGKGATFTVEFPAVTRETFELARVEGNLARERGNGSTDSKVEQNHQSLKGLRILFVDDDPGARESIGAVLTSLGAKVTAAESAEEAISLLPKVKPDVLVSDLAMPGEDGYSLLRRLRKRSAAQHGKIPALALTAYATVEESKRALASGFQAHLAKPVDSFQLAEVISRIAKQKES